MDALPRLALSRPPLHCWQAYAALFADGWPTIGQLDQLRMTAERVDGVPRPALRVQTRELLADGLHYEQRIAQGMLATREDDAHDAFNALVWLRHPRLKHALNARQCADIAILGAKQRSRAQCALTHFDEAGAIVWIDSDAALACWDAHDWQGLFERHRADWGHRIAVTVFGHALLEHVAGRDMLPMARALVVAVSRSEIAARADMFCVIDGWPAGESAIADAMASGRLLTDPQQLRPLPLAGLPGWHAAQGSDDFLSLPCFRPLRPGRRYPEPFAIEPR